MKQFLFVLALTLVPSMVSAQTPQVQCQPLDKVMAISSITPLMRDTDGDFWLRVQIRGTKRVLIGFVRQYKEFCPVSEGVANPET